MTTKDYLLKAQDNHFAIGAFNAANIETINAIVAAAVKLNSPVIIEASHGEIEHIGIKNFVDIIQNAREDTGLPIFSNLDHAPSVEDALLGINHKFDLVHFNGSSLPFEEDLIKTKQVVDTAHAASILVEAELDAITGNSSLHDTTAAEALSKAHLTDPATAATFVTTTGLDTLAASFGSVHGLYQTEKHLDIELLKKIRESVSCFLSLHGGSDMPEDQVKAAIENGVVKINVNSELRLAFKETLKNALQNSDELAIYKLMPPVIEAVQKIVESKILLFGSQNQA